jgi:hypothetical protein
MVSAPHSLNRHGRAKFRPSTSGRATIHHHLKCCNMQPVLRAAFSAPHDVDGRDKPGHDGGEGVAFAAVFWDSGMLSSTAASTLPWRTQTE